MSVSRLALSAVSVAILAFAAQAADAPGLAPDLTVNGKAISQNQVTLMSGNFVADKSTPGPEARAAARAELITQEVLAQAARKAGLDKAPGVVDQLAFQERSILSKAYLENYFDKNPVTEDALKASYEFSRANGKIVEYRLRQILVSTPEQAVEVIGKLDKGADFAELAKKETLDPGGQNNGGDLGWFRPDIFVDHGFTDALGAIRKGDYNHQPVRSRFGWHVIKVEDGPRVVANAESWDTLDEHAKTAIRQKTTQLKLEALTAKLAGEAKIAGPGAKASTARNAR
jgi:peptidyl-prolyl cis-trans isomerase C